MLMLICTPRKGETVKMGKLQKIVVKLALAYLKRHRPLLCKIFVYLADYLVDLTSNDLNEELSRVLRESLGNPDVSDLK